MSDNRSAWQIMAPLFILLVLSACAPPPSNLPPLPPLPQGAKVIENEGQVCFEKFENSTELRAFSFPKGCSSSSCTLPIQQAGNSIVNQDNFELHFYTRFVLIDPYGAQSHGGTQDCGGGGTVRFEIGNVEKGTYSIWLGEKKIGDLDVPMKPTTEFNICFGDRGF